MYTVKQLFVLKRTGEFFDPGTTLLADRLTPDEAKRGLARGLIERVEPLVKPPPRQKKTGKADDHHAV